MIFVDVRVRVRILRDKVVDFGRKVPNCEYKCTLRSSTIRNVVISR